MKPNSRNKKTILHVEDDSDQRELISSVIAPKFTYIGIENAEGAELILRDETVDLVILDLALPLMNGFEFLEKNKRQIRDRKIPVIVTTGLEGANIESLCRDHQCKAYFKKPLDLKSLLNNIQDILKS
ncbi:MAG: response regulator [Candidatus Mariimomonas ferrooxydans]